MARSQSKPWIGVTIALSVIVVVAGYLAFQRKFGFPASLIWTAAAVALATPPGLEPGTPSLEG